VVVALSFALGGVARADKAKDARKAYDEATAAFGLGRYAEAAEKYEQAFSLRPDPALLYNAAQAYRLAGNKPRALELYKNCLRLYPDFKNAEDARSHVATLKKQLEDDQHAAAPPPAPHAPAAAPAPVPAPAPATSGLPAMPPPVLTVPPPVTSAPASTPPLAAESSVPSVSANASPEDQRSLFQKPWFWVVVGAAVLGGTVAILLATGGTKYPDATFGNAKGN